MTTRQSRRIWTVALALAALSATQLAAQIEPKISLVDRSTFRSTRYHPSGADSLSRFITNHMGGVLSQGDFDPSDQAPLLEGSYLALPGEVDDHFCVMINEGSTCVRYDIEYAELVPLVMWVGSGATSAFTAIFDVHDEQFQKDAGFAPVRSDEHGRSMAALEFVGTPFEGILHYLDFCQACTGPSDAEVVDRYNRRLDDDPAWQEVLVGERLVRDWESTYINTDLDSAFVPSIDEGVLSLHGQPARYQWRGFPESDLRRIESVGPFFDSEESVKLERQRLRRELASTAEAFSVAVAAVEQMEEPSELVRDSLQELAAKKGLEMLITIIAAERMDSTLHERGLWFFQTSAMLRYYRNSDSARWMQFLESVQDRSDQMPEPWNLYATVFEEVYGRSPFPTVH